ncbi:type II toxin-antitoxin system VapC family toxin [Microbacterium sp.]|uniref:type II toxin-antitoxin system VapC family toxin n=1 Tax=Microbacterium sp. TaxID=51671 RepID=UPI0039E493CD
MIVLDASAMIAILDDRDAHHATAVDVMTREARQMFVSHRLTLSEALVRSVSRGRGEEAAAALAAMGVEPIDTLDDPLALAEVRHRSRLQMPDACVLFAAIRASAQLVTFDARLADAAERFGVRVIR